VSGRGGEGEEIDQMGWGILIEKSNRKKTRKGGGNFKKVGGLENGMGEVEEKNGW